MRGRRNHRALLAIDQLVNTNRREGNGFSNLVRNSFDFDGLTDLRSADIGNVDIDASTCFVEAVSSNGQSTTPVH